jgi:signal peptidase I
MPFHPSALPVFPQVQADLPAGWPIGTKATLYSQIEKQNEGDEEPMDTQAERSPPERVEAKRTVLSFFIKALALCLGLLIVFTFVFGIRQVSGNAMYPRISNGDLILYYRLEQSYTTDDVVSFQEGKYHLLGRIVAQGGDVIDVDDQGYLTVNGHTLDEDKIFYPTQAITGGITYPYTVEEGSYFVLCDYRTAVSDSRYYGAIAKSDLDGKVISLLRRRDL